MNNCNVFVIFSLAIYVERCWGGYDDSKEKDDDSTGLTMGQVAAMAIGGAVVFALIIIAIIAIVLKCNKKAKPAVQPAHVQSVSEVTQTKKFSNTAPLYDDLPPKYSLRDDGPSHKVSLPPYSETYPSKHVV